MKKLLMKKLNKFFNISGMEVVIDYHINKRWMVLIKKYYLIRDVFIYHFIFYQKYKIFCVYILN
jgi:hypothetical protein